MEKTILIVEDDDVSYHLFESILRNYKVKLRRAYDGIDAVEHCYKSNDLDLVLMDIKMPALDGYNATAIIKKEKNGLPIIAQTACVSPSDIERIKSSAFDDYISKPIDAKELIQKINNITSLTKIKKN